MKKVFIFIVAFIFFISLSVAPFYFGEYLNDLDNVSSDLVISLIVLFSMSVMVAFLATTLED